MCDFCNKPGIAPYQYAYKSKYYTGLISVMLCDDCAKEVTKAGSVSNYLRREKECQK
jgi:hypothetical protein